MSGLVEIRMLDTGYKKLELILNFEGSFNFKKTFKQLRANV
jgi:hypothetical protein